MKQHNKSLILKASLFTLFAMSLSANSIYAQDTFNPEDVELKIDKNNYGNIVTTKRLPVYETMEVSGIVLDASTKQPLPGARVQAYNNSRYSAMTDDNGKYSFKVPVFVTSLYVTAPQYNDIQVAQHGTESKTILMYSDKFKSTYTSQNIITSQKTITIENSSAISADGEIDSKLAGDIYTINRDGVPGQGSAMFVRGLNSLNLNAQPLIVLDGIIMDMQLDRTSIHDGFFNNILSAIDVEDIESIQVLKNGTALYGSRGANGVLIINTRRGHSMATKINVSVFGGFETKPSKMKVLNANQYRNYASELIGTTEYGLKYSSANISIPFLNDNPQYYWYPMYHNDTDWSKGLYQNAFTQNYKVNVQGGDDVAMYNLSLGYSSAQATAKNNAFDRLNIRFNTDINLLKDLNTQLDISFSRVTNNLRDNGWAESYEDSPITSPNILGQIQAPFLSIYSYYTGEDAQLHQSSQYAGKYYSDDNYPFAFAERYGTNTALANPYWILKNGDAVNKNNQEVTQFNLNVMPKWQINKYLYLTNRFAYQLNRASEKYYLPIAGTPEYVLENMGIIQGVKKSLFNKETSLYNDLRINWIRNLGKHDVALFGGFRFTSNSFSENHLVGYITPGAGNDKMPDNKSSDSFSSVEGNNDTWKNLAYYANAQYSFKNKYVAEASLTAESSSRFGKQCNDGINMFGVKWGIFPSLQLGWIISNESWMKNVKNIDYLKFTAGYDVSGNDNFDYSASRTYFKAVTYLKSAIGLQIVNIENPELQWETTHKWNFGLNGAFFKNRVNAGIDFYVSNTNNLITSKSLNYLAGLETYLCNGGSLRNVGLEANLNAILINKKDFKWQLGTTIGHYKNKIVTLPEDHYITKLYDAEIYTSVGNAAGVFYGFKTNGVFATDAEALSAGKDGYLKFPTGIESKPYTDFHAGDIHFVDLNNDGIINNDDKTVIGNPNPKLYGNIYSNFNMKRWSLDIIFKYCIGNDIYNYHRRQLESMNGFYNQSLAVVNRWTCEGQQTDMPRACTVESDDWVNNERFSDRWIEDGSFLKLKKVRLSYQMPISLNWIQGLTLWAEANNVFTAKKYTGSDPESSCGNGILYQGIDAGLLPSNRSFNIGVKFNL
ncbi:MAG: SusC/RagA family TonB-linked outer membrane protein [Bacteroidaceae bacterium]|nr:SusC/RagA family TonB-linked outer membrane protein [Bacteroidaceae bacterium]